jgi:hypothetical protein
LACLVLFGTMIRGPAGAADPAGQPAATTTSPSAASLAAEDKCPAETAATVRPPAVPVGVLVRRLGDPAFAVREEAEAGIRAMGIAARGEIVLGLRSSDAEVRRRCRRLLHAVVAADFQERLQAFKADAQGRQDHRLPGWERFRRVVGTDAQSRELFVKMFEAEPGLLASGELDRATAFEAFEARLTQIQVAMHYPFAGQSRQPSLGSTAAVFFLASDPAKAPPEQLQQFVRNAAYNGEFHQAITNGPLKAGVRKLFAAWLLAPTGDGMRMSKLNDAMTLDIKEALPLALECLAPQGAGAAPGAMAGAGLKHWSIEAVARLGGQAHAARLVPFLDDPADCVTAQINNKQVTVQVRDVALAWLVHLTGQDHKDYGTPEAGKFIAGLR